MVVATFNAASIRARMPILVEWLAQHEPDLLAIQETKVEDDKLDISELEELGYHVTLHGQKSWNGVAILSLQPATNVVRGFVDDLFPEDARIVAAEVNGIQFINTYVPNGNTVGSEKWEYKMRWLERFRRMLDERYRPTQPLVWLGDVNIAPTPGDVFDSKRMYGQVGHHPDEFSRLDKIVEWGLTDLFRLHSQEAGEFTFWDFVIPKSVERNLGWRIDHIYGTQPIVEKCKRCWVDREPRSLTRPSDHTFVLAEIDW